jgi:hypothetical protein
MKTRSNPNSKLNHIPDVSFSGNEERLNYLLKSSPAVFYSCKASGDFGATFISENIQPNFGYSPEDFTSDSGFWAGKIHPDDRSRVFDDLKILFEKG